MDDIKTLSDSFKDAQAVAMAEKIKKLEEENAHLKMLLESSTPLINDAGGLILSDEESIARMELKKLKQVSFQRDLTLEEARKVEIYTKIINTPNKDKKANKEKEVAVLDDSNLLKLVENNEQG